MRNFATETSFRCNLASLTTTDSRLSHLLTRSLTPALSQGEGEWEMVFKNSKKKMGQDVTKKNALQQGSELAAGKLSMVLRRTMLNPQAFTKAVEQEYIKVREDGQLEWTMQSVTLLAYFCGRLWSGDMGVYSRRKDCMLWKMGELRFPSTELGLLFDVPLLRQTRNCRKNLSLPEYYELIDSLFVRE